MVYRVGVTAGLHFIGNSPELSTPIRKIGFALTRGADMMQVDLDYAYEITYTDGADVRHIAKKQGLLLAAHGDLNLPIGVPERNDWRDAFDRMARSVQSAVFMGASYVDFHACLNIWLELLTYTSHKLEIAYVDHRGKFISDILFEVPKLRDWFIEKRLDGGFIQQILTADDRKKIKNERQNERNAILARLNKLRQQDDDIVKKFKEGKIKEEDQAQWIGKLETIREQEAEEQNNIQRVDSAEHESDLTIKMVREKFASKDPKARKWDTEDMRGASLVEGHLIMFHYLFYTKDKVFEEVLNQYKSLKEKYKFNYNNVD